MALCNRWDVPGGWGEVARIVAGTTWAPPPILLPDANVAIYAGATPFWDAARLSSLRSGAPTVGITSPVYVELKEWLEKPYRETERAASISAALESTGGWCEYLDLPDIQNECVRQGVKWYVSLMMLRRNLAVSRVDTGRTPFAADAADRGAAMNAVKDKAGQRGVALAKKGRADWEGTGRAYKLNDEAQVVLAFAVAFTTGRDVTLVTADADVFEAFFKFQYLLNLHYRALLAAEAIARGDWGRPDRVWEDHGNVFFDGPVQLYRRTRDLDDVLPKTSEPIGVGVIYVAPDERVSTMTVNSERRVIEVFATKGRTSGRATDLFGAAERPRRSLAGRVRVRHGRELRRDRRRRADASRPARRRKIYPPEGRRRADRLRPGTVRVAEVRSQPRGLTGGCQRGGGLIADFTRSFRREPERRTGLERQLGLSRDQAVSRGKTKRNRGQVNPLC